MSKLLEELEKLVDEALAEAEKRLPEAPDPDALVRIRARYGLGQPEPAQAEKVDEAALREELAELKRKLGK